MSRKPLLVRWQLAVVTAVLVAILYDSALKLPFFFDDLDHMPYVAATGLPAIWGSSGGFPYYRPLMATVWRLFYLVGGGHSPLALHALNLFLHFLNGWLLGQIAWWWLAGGRAEIRYWASMLTAAIFVCFPFSYQAVPWIGAGYHLLATTLVLAAVWLTLKGVDSGRRGWLGGAAAAAFMAPFAHENGLVLVGLLPAAAYLYRPEKFKPSLAAWGLWLTPGALWLIIWLAVPKERPTGFGQFNLEAVGQNLVYFFQGLAFPTTIFTGRLVSQLGWSDFGVVLGFGSLALLLVVLAWRGATDDPGVRRLLLFGLAWWGVSIAPAVATLDFAYVLSSPRLLMLPSAGIALVWGGAAAVGLGAGRRSVRLLSGTAAAYTLVAGAWMIGVHMTQHAALGRIWREAVEITNVANRPGYDTAPVFINLPTALAGRQPFFPVGHEGTVFMVPYIPGQRIIDVQAGRETHFVLRTFEDIRPQRDYIYDVIGSGQDWPEILGQYERIDVWLVDYLEDDLRLRQVGSSITPTRPTFPAKFEELESQVLTVTAEATAGAKTMTVDIVWRVGDNPPPYEWTAFVHVLDGDGKLIAQADGHPWAGTYPLGQWAPRAQQLDRREITLERPVDGPLEIQIGLYHAVSQERAAILLPDGTSGTALPVAAGVRD